MAAAFRKAQALKLPFQRGLLRITGDTLEGPRESDRFEVVAGPGSEVGVVLLDVHTRHGEQATIGERLLLTAARGIAERTPLHAIMLDLVRALFEFRGTELGVTIARYSLTEARVEVTTAGMPPLACVHADGYITTHPAASPPLTATTSMPPPVEVVPLIWGSTWLAVSDGFTAGSNQPDVVARLARDLGLDVHGLRLSGEAPDALYDVLTGLVSQSGPFMRDDATLVLIGTDPNARFESEIRPQTPR